MEDNETVKLTTLSTKGGCGCKIGPADLSEVLNSLPSKVPNENVLVGLDTSDDAGVYKLTNDLAIVQTLDFFTPIVDNPYDFGQVAATNAISDIYAMGGKPVTALNIVAFPITLLDKSILSEILRGAADKLNEADVALIGGHSIDDQEPKYGLSVTGTIHPDKIQTNTGAKPGDLLILTKPIGVGILTTALKRGLLNDEEIENVTSVMTTLNKAAAETIEPYDVHAITDVTGFGLLGHTSEIAIGSSVGITLYNDKIPVLTRAEQLCSEGAVPSGTKNNFKHIENIVDFPDEMSQIRKWVLSDAVTSGGLLISISKKDANKVYDELKNNGVDAHIIGEVTNTHIGGIIIQ